MKQVVAYRSEDGTIHPTKSACEAADFMFTIRGFFNRAGIDLTGTTGKISSAITANMDEFSEIIRKRKAQLNRDQKEHNTSRSPSVNPSYLVG